MRRSNAVLRQCAAALALTVSIVALWAPATQAAPAGRAAVIANGWSPSDVGTAAPLAASLGGSVLYSSKDTLGVETAAALRELSPSKVILVGGTAAISEGVEAELADLLPGVPVERLAGADRIDTAAQAALYTLGLKSEDARLAVREVVCVFQVGAAVDASGSAHMAIAGALLAGLSDVDSIVGLYTSIAQIHVDHLNRTIDGLAECAAWQPAFGAQLPSLRERSATLRSQITAIRDAAE